MFGSFFNNKSQRKPSFLSICCCSWVGKLQHTYILVHSGKQCVSYLDGLDRQESSRDPSEKWEGERHWISTFCLSLAWLQDIDRSSAVLKWMLTKKQATRLCTFQGKDPLAAFEPHVNCTVYDAGWRVQEVFLSKQLQLNAVYIYI